MGWSSTKAIRTGAGLFVAIAVAIPPSAVAVSVVFTAAAISGVPIAVSVPATILTAADISGIAVTIAVALSSTCGITVPAAAAPVSAATIVTTSAAVPAAIASGIAVGRGRGTGCRFAVRFRLAAIPAHGFAVSLGVAGGSRRGLTGSKRGRATSIADHHRALSRRYRQRFAVNPHLGFAVAHDD
jgi:hypothetical protein